MIKIAMIITTALSCPKTLIRNNTEEWNMQDMQTLSRAKTRCAELYVDSRCLKKFIKNDDRSYLAICGE